MLSDHVLDEPFSGSHLPPGSRQAKVFAPPPDFWHVQPVLFLLSHRWRTHTKGQTPG